MNILRHFSVAALGFIFSVLLSWLLFVHLHSRFQNLVEISDFLLSPLLFSLNFCFKPFSFLYFLVNGALGGPRVKHMFNMPCLTDSFLFSEKNVNFLTTKIGLVKLAINSKVLSTTKYLLYQKHVNWKQTL